MNNKIIGILGGTFDPIHLGHTWIAQTILREKLVEEIHFLPCYAPVHKKTPVASAQHREAMIQLAIKGLDNCHLNRFEMAQKKPMYMCNTFAALAQQNITPVLIVGSDVWANFHTWKNPNIILENGHILVINRPDYPWPPQMPKAFYPPHALTENPGILQQVPCGHIIMHQLDFPNEFYDNFSSSALRQQLSHNENPSQRLDARVLAYCQQQHLYENNS